MSVTPHRTSRWFVVTVFVTGLSLGLFAKGKGLDPSTWSGREPGEAASVLLDLAIAEAGGGSWERIAVGRIHYLSGNTAEAEAIFSGYTGPKAEASDLIRIARVYVKAGDWEKARPLADRVVELAPDDRDWLVEVGAYYNLNGDRARAEELFARGFAKKADMWALLDAAGSYLEVPVQRN